MKVSSERPTPRIEYPTGPLHSVLAQTAANRPEARAIVFKDRILTFADIDRESNRLAQGLAGLGLAKGDRLALFTPNCPEYEVAFYAATKLGAVPTPVNPSYRERELAYHCNESGATMLLAHEAVRPLVEAARADLGSVGEVIVIGSDGAAGARSYADIVAGSPDAPPGIEVGLDDLAALPFSSGTTGLPKGVMLTHRNLVYNHAQFGTAGGLGADDVLLVFLPLYHIYGVLLMGASVWSGARQVLMERFDLAEALRLVQSEGVTWFYAVPPVLLALADAPDAAAEQFRSVKFIMNAAAPLAPDVARRVEDRLGVRVIQAYGLTEASPDSHMSPLEPDRIRLESGGVPVADTEHRVVDMEEGTRVLGPGEVGEILIRGPQVMRGYWNAQAETARTIRDGWLHSGDIGSIDADGYVYILDRKKEMIKYKAFSIAPAELESALLEHQAVLDCGVTAFVDPEAGEVPKAFYVLRTGMDVAEDELDAFITARLAGYKRIRRWQRVGAIPRTPSGKILRRELRLLETKPDQTVPTGPSGPGRPPERPPRPPI